METLRAEFGGPEIEPHITVVGSVLWRHDDAVKNFVSGCENIEPYLCEVNELVTRKFYYQPVSLLFQPCDWVCLTFLLFTLVFCFGGENVTLIIYILRLCFASFKSSFYFYEPEKKRKKNEEEEVGCKFK